MFLDTVSAQNPAARSQGGYSRPAAGQVGAAATVTVVVEAFIAIETLGSTVVMVVVEVVVAVEVILPISWTRVFVRVVVLIAREMRGGRIMVRAGACAITIVIFLTWTMMLPVP